MKYEIESLGLYTKSLNDLQDLYNSIFTSITEVEEVVAPLASILNQNIASQKEHSGQILQEFRLMQATIQDKYASSRQELKDVMRNYQASTAHLQNRDSSTLYQNHEELINPPKISQDPKVSEMFKSKKNQLNNTRKTLMKQLKKEAASSISITLRDIQTANNDLSRLEEMSERLAHIKESVNATLETNKNHLLIIRETFIALEPLIFERWGQSDHKTLPMEQSSIMNNDSTIMEKTNPAISDIFSNYRLRLTQFLDEICISLEPLRAEIADMSDESSEISIHTTRKNISIRTSPIVVEDQVLRNQTINLVDFHQEQPDQQGALESDPLNNFINVPETQTAGETSSTHLNDFNHTGMNNTGFINNAPASNDLSVIDSATMQPLPMYQMLDTNPFPDEFFSSFFSPLDNLEPCSPNTLNTFQQADQQPSQSDYPQPNVCVSEQNLHSSPEIEAWLNESFFNQQHASTIEQKPIRKISILEQLESMLYHHNNLANPTRLLSDIKTILNQYPNDTSDRLILILSLKEELITKLTTKFKTKSSFSNYFGLWWAVKQLRNDPEMQHFSVAWQNVWKTWESFFPEGLEDIFHAHNNSDPTVLLENVASFVHKHAKNQTQKFSVLFNLDKELLKKLTIQFEDKSAFYNYFKAHPNIAYRVSKQALKNFDAAFDETFLLYKNSKGVFSNIGRR